MHQDQGSGREGSYFNEEGLAVPSWAGGGSYSDLTVILVLVSGRITNMQFCINIGGVILECGGDMMFYIGGGGRGLILKCDGDMMFYIDGLILGCQGTQGGVGSSGGGGGYCQT